MYIPPSLVKNGCDVVTSLQPAIHSQLVTTPHMEPFFLEIRWNHKESVPILIGDILLSDSTVWLRSMASSS